MKKTYADECLERAEEATGGPWSEYQYGVCSEKVYNSVNERLNICGEVKPRDAEFIAHSRTDVVELARKLKKACDRLRFAAKRFYFEGYLMDALYFNQIAEELEAMPVREN